MDFTTTAVARPEIVDRTYSSFSNNMKGLSLKEHCTLYINIDPLPLGSDPLEVVNVAKKYFKEVVYNTPEKPNFTAAYNWIWSSAKSKIIFNLEDDWILTEEINVPELLKNFEKNKTLYLVALRSYSSSYKKCPLSPSFMHRRYYGRIAGKLNENINPEIQLRGRKFGLEMPSPEDNISQKGKLVVYPKKKIIVKDIGRKWIKKTNLAKPAKKSGFTSWVKR